MIYLMRHANTECSNERPLSTIGITEAKTMALFIKSIKSIREIIHSTKLRAVQTTKIIQEHNPSIIATPNQALETFESINDNFLSKIYSYKNTMFVGHMPFISILANKLLNKNDCQREKINFKTATIAAFKNTYQETWTIDFVVHPQILDKFMSQ